MDTPLNFWTILSERLIGVTKLMTPCFRNSYCIVFNFDTEGSRFTHAD